MYIREDPGESRLELPHIDKQKDEEQADPQRRAFPRRTHQCTRSASNTAPVMLPSASATGKRIARFRAGTTLASAALKS